MTIYTCNACNRDQACVIIEGGKLVPHLCPHITDMEADWQAKA